MHDQDTFLKLWTLCEKFIEDNKIYCGETVCQSDRVIENAYTFLIEMCEIVGYAKYEDEDDEISED